MRETLTIPTLPKVSVVGSPITALPFDDQIQIIARWAQDRVSRVVCVANVHMLMEAYWHQPFKTVLEEADMVTPDGMPLVWMMKLMGSRQQNRVAGMDIFMALCQAASQQGSSIFCVGSTPEVLNQMGKYLKQDFPHLQVAGLEPLPFRPLTPEEDEALIEKINQSGAGIVFVSLGCPKQENWMAQHKGKINAPMIGVGGVFPVYAGLQKRAPRWVREAGFEWFYRFAQEPRRLWKRYSQTIPPFIWLALMQLVQQPNLQDRFRVRLRA